MEDWWCLREFEFWKGQELLECSNLLILKSNNGNTYKKRGESGLDLVLLLNSSNNHVRKEELIFLVCFLIKVKQWKEKSLGVGLQDFVLARKMLVFKM